MSRSPSTNEYVNGSGSEWFRGKAERMTFLNWMQCGGMASMSEWWYSARNSGKSCSSTSRIRIDPLKNTRDASCILGAVRNGDRNLNSATSSVWYSAQF